MKLPTQPLKSVATLPFTSLYFDFVLTSLLNRSFNPNNKLGLFLFFGAPMGYFGGLDKVQQGFEAQYIITAKV